MSIYKTFCDEITDNNGILQSITLNYPDNFNFGYNVVDRIAEDDPQKRALVWCGADDEEHIFTFSDVSKYSNQTANVLSAAGISRGDRVVTALETEHLSVKLWSVQKDIDGFENLSTAMQCADDTFARIQTNADDPMLLYFTSDTTGEPKGVIHTHTYL